MMLDHRKSAQMGTKRVQNSRQFRQQHAGADTPAGTGVPVRDAKRGAATDLLHGKEGVDGSSPSEGSGKFLLISPFRLPARDPSWLRRPPSVHRPPRCAFTGPGNRVTVRPCGPARRRPPSVHGPFERERVEERDGVLVAVDCEVAVVEIVKGAKIRVATLGREDWEDRRHGLLVPLPRRAGSPWRACS